MNAQIHCFKNGQLIWTYSTQSIEQAKRMAKRINESPYWDHCRALVVF